MRKMNGQTISAGAELAWRMKKGFLIAAAIGCIAIMIESLGSHVSKQARSDDMAIVALSRDQSVLALRVAMLAKRSVHYDDPAMNATARALLSPTLAQLKETHQALGVAMNGRPAYHASAALKHHYEKDDVGLRAQIEAYITEASHFINNQDAPREAAVALKDRAIGGLFDDLEKSAELYLDYVEDNMLMHRNRTLLAQAFILLLLAAVVMFIFRPLTRLAAAKADELEVKAIELEQRASEARAANEAKTAFLANMSHEIRTPLNGVLGLADLLKRTKLSAEQSSLLNDLSRSGWALLGLLNSILDIARIEANALELSAQPFVLRDVVEQVKLLHQTSAQNAGLQFDIKIAPDMPHGFVGDQHRLTQVLHNLVGNAIKFTEQGHVDVTFDLAEDGRFRITVTDSGIGMTKDQMDMAWERFAQADTRTTRRYGGSGLGLAIVSNVIAAMGGDIQLDSQLGQGTKVTVMLPLPPVTHPIPAADTQSDDLPPELPASLQKLRLLVAEDNKTNRRIIETILVKHGFSPVFAENGKQALDAALQNDFDLLLFDISMPVMDGIEALQRINQACKQRHRLSPPAIAISANVMTQQVDEYARAGFAHVLAKPYKSAELLAAIKQYQPRFACTEAM